MDVLFLLVGWFVSIKRQPAWQISIFIEVAHMTPGMFYGWSMLKYVELKLFGNQSKI